MNNSNRSDSDQPERPNRIGLTDTLGIVILAGALFNLPAILKKPASDADWMMLVIVLVMLLIGAVLLGVPRLLERKRR